MLVSISEGARVVAAKSLDRSRTYCCPACRDAVMLKAGDVNAPHFAHYPGSDCQYGTGETEWHRRGKLYIGAYSGTTAPVDGAFTFVGNVSEFTVEPTEDVLEHQDYTSGTRTIDEEVTLEAGYQGTSSKALNFSS